MFTSRVEVVFGSWILDGGELHASVGDSVRFRAASAGSAPPTPSYVFRHSLGLW